MTFLDYLDLLRQRLVVAVAVIGATAFLAMALAFARGPEYKAQTRLRALPPATGSTAEELLAKEQTDLVTESELLRSTKVAERVKLKLEAPEADPDALIESIKVTALTGSAIMIVEASAPRPDIAVSLANTFAAAYLEVRRETANERLDFFGKAAAEKYNAAVVRANELDNQLARVPPTSDVATNLKAERLKAATDVSFYAEQLRAASDRRAISEGFGEITRPAIKATPVRVASPVRSLVFGLLMGVVLAIAAALLLDALSNTVRTRDDARSHSGAEVLAVVPEDIDWDESTVARLVTDADPLSPTSEAYRTLRQNLRVAMADIDNPTPTILVTSPGPGEGKSATSANLALAFADTGETALAVDCDLRQPRLHDFFATNDAPGMTDVLEEEADPASLVQWLRPRVGFLPAGEAVDRPDRALMQADLPYLLSSLSAAATTGAAGSRRRTKAGGNGTRPIKIEGAAVLLDAAPILHASEVSSLASVTDGVILVLRSGVTSREATAHAAEQVRKGGGRLLGVVLVGVRADVNVAGGRRYGRYTRVLARASAAGKAGAPA